MTTVFSFRIVGFHNCDGCTRKVRNALRRFHGLQLVNLGRESGIVTVVSIAEHHPEVIRYALERQMKKSVVIVSINQNPSSTVSATVPSQRTFDLQGLGEAMLGMFQVLDGVEITRSDTLRVNFIHRENPPVVRVEPRRNISSYGDVDVEHAPRRPTPRAPPWPVVEPSAPLISTEEEEVYGYPPEFYYGYATTDHSHDHRPDGCCRIM
ncbi:hypothetical protein Lser_V15G08841 [Lactuca serriola]